MRYSLLLVVLSLLVNLGCDHPDVQRAMNSAQTSIDIEGATSTAKGEVEKLFQIDYRVLEISRFASPTELEATLKKMGEERWDCFETIEGATTTQILCKRVPPSYLRYLRQML
jgi:hypothetical protein